jgi:hypothetical protein
MMAHPPKDSKSVRFCLYLRVCQGQLKGVRETSKNKRNDGVMLDSISRDRAAKEAMPIH